MYKRQGLCPCYGGRGTDIERWRDTVKATFDELKLRRPFMDGETAKYGALLVSQQSRDFHDWSGMWNAVGRMESIQRTEHLLTDVIFDNALTTDGLAPYPVVILSNSACLSDDQCEVLRKYVHDGGTLLATMETSLYDEWGNRRDNFALADLFGVDYVESHEEAAQIMVCQTDELKQKFGRFVNFVAPAVEFKLRADSDAEVLLTKSSRPLYTLSVNFKSYDSDVPTVVRRRVGNGLVYYIGLDVARGYVRDKLPQVAKCFGHLQRTATRPPVEFAAPKLLEVTALRPDDKRIVVHLVNVTAWAPTSHQMAPLANIELRVHEGPLKRATLGLSGTELAVHDNTVMVPAVGYGEVVVLELE